MSGLHLLIHLLEYLAVGTTLGLGCQTLWPESLFDERTPTRLILAGLVLWPLVAIVVFVSTVVATAVDVFDEYQERS